MTDDRRETLLKEYTEVGQTFRLLTDIRFKLLAFLPLAAGVAGAVVSRTTPQPATLAFSVFGLVVTLGLITYNARNDQLYDTLVFRAAALERKLGNPDGAFANRPRPWLQFAAAGLHWKVDHRTAVATIYSATIALWLFGATDSTVQIVYKLAAGRPAPQWARLIAVGAAIAITGLGAALTTTRKKRRECELRRQGKAAVLAVAAKDPVKLIGDPEACKSLAELADDRPSGRPSSSEALAVVEARLRYLSEIPRKNVSYFIGQDSGLWAAAQTVAYITDFAPEWVYDCATSRRRNGDRGRRRAGPGCRRVGELDGETAYTATLSHISGCETTASGSWQERIVAVESGSHDG
jgi:hypothetical protein